MRLTPESARAGLLALAAFAVGPVALQAPLGTAPLLVVVAAGLAAVLVWERQRPAFGGWPALLLGLLALLALLSSAWAVDPAHSLWRAVRLAVECVEGLLLFDAAGRLDAPARRRVLRALLLGVALALAMILIDRALGGGLSRLLHGRLSPPTVTNRGATVLALLLWPAALHLVEIRGRIAGLAGGVALAAGIGLLLSASAHLAVVVGGVTLLVARGLRRGLGRLVAGLALLVVLAMPLLPILSPPDAPALPPSLLKPSALARLVIWQFAVERIAERPVLGWGLDAARAIPGGKEVSVVRASDGQTYAIERMSLHPHNGPLQLWLELGGLGALLGAGFAAAVGRRAASASLPPATRGVAVAVFAAGLVELSLSYGLWQSWWIAALWLAAMLTRLAAVPAAGLPTGGGALPSVRSPERSA